LEGQGRRTSSRRENQATRRSGPASTASGGWRPGGHRSSAWAACRQARFGQWRAVALAALACQPALRAGRRRRRATAGRPQRGRAGSGGRCY
jgi:hypothetical protein